MKIVVLSDTHGNTPLAVRACDLAVPDAVIHLGDGGQEAEMLSLLLDVPVIGVAGNCDRSYDAPRERVWECSGRRLLLTHGDIYRVKSGMQLLEERGKELGVDAVLYGHTHLAAVATISEMLFVNPGHLNGLPGGSFAILDITPDGITARIHPIDSAQSP